MKKLYSGMLVAVAVAGFGLSAHAKVIYHKGCAFPDAPKDRNCVEYGTDDAKGKRDCYIDVYSPGSWSTAEVSDGSQHDIGEGAPGKWARAMILSDHEGRCTFEFSHKKVPPMFHRRW